MRNSCPPGFVLTVAILVLTIGSTPTRGQTTGLRSADLARMRSVGAVALSPDATRIAYTILSAISRDGLTPRYG